MNGEEINTGTLGEDTTVQELTDFMVNKLEGEPGAVIGISNAKYKLVGNRILIMIMADRTATPEMVYEAFGRELDSVTGPGTTEAIAALQLGLVFEDSETLQ